MNILKINIILLLCVFCFTSSCQFQKKESDNTRISNQKIIQEIGTNVMELDSSITTIFQDSQNNYWFGSERQGAYYYDGKRLVQYTTKDGLGGNRIREIKEDNLGNVYFDCWSDIYKFDGKPSDS